MLNWGSWRTSRDTSYCCLEAIEKKNKSTGERSSEGVTRPGEQGKRQGGIRNNK